MLRRAVERISLADCAEVQFHPGAGEANSLCGRSEQQMLAADARQGFVDCRLRRHLPLAAVETPNFRQRSAGDVYRTVGLVMQLFRLHKQIEQSLLDDDRFTRGPLV